MFLDLGSGRTVGTNKCVNSFSDPILIQTLPPPQTPTPTHHHIPTGTAHPSSSILSAILWCHRVGFTLTKRASIGGMKLFLTSST